MASASQAPSEATNFGRTEPRPEVLFSFASRLQCLSTRELDPKCKVSLAQLLGSCLDLYPTTDNLTF